MISVKFPILILRKRRIFYFLYSLIAIPNCIKRNMEEIPSKGIKGNDCPKKGNIPNGTIKYINTLTKMAMIIDETSKEP